MSDPREASCKPRSVSKAFVIGLVGVLAFAGMAAALSAIALKLA